jgi:oligopeptide transport system ATP-binding protein
MTDRQPLLDIRSLSVEFVLPKGQLRAVRDVSLHVGTGETVALVGESGSGKSVTARSVLGLLEPPAQVTGGEIFFDGKDLLRASRSEIRAIRGDSISLVLQDAMTSLNPVQTVGHQIV